MKRNTLSRIILMIMSINILNANTYTLNTLELNNSTQQPNTIKSIRNIMGENNPIKHTKAQLRMGYITLKEDSNERNAAYALGGHFHLDTHRWNGMEIGLSAYTVLDLGIDQNINHVNADFFDVDGNSFITLTEAYLDGKWGGTEVKLGRQILDTPHVDSDDIRMMPNYFESYTLTHTDIDDLTLSAGFITKMAGWENGEDASRFVHVSKTLGTHENTDGIYYAVASYEGIKDLSLDLWYYHYSDIANILYAELGYTYEVSVYTQLTFGFQYDGSKETGATLLDKQNAQTYGLSAEANFKDLGLTVLAAYNQDKGNGASGLSLGGGPFFTSMEDQTLDAIGGPGSAWVLGAAYNFETININGLSTGVAYGKFKSSDETHYESSEIDIILEYSWNEKILLTAAFSSIEFNAGMDEEYHTLKDYNQLRIIANYNF